MTKIKLAHSELTNTIYAIIGTEKIDITEQAIAEVKAIKELEQEPKTDELVGNSEEMDCIDRAEAMTEIQMNTRRYTIAKEFGGMGQVEWSDNLISIKDALDILRKLPSVQPKTDWIPVSERLPEENTIVLGTTRWNDLYQTEIYDDCGQTKWLSNGSYDVPIVAWMPLPQAYKAESEG